MLTSPRCFCQKKPIICLLINTSSVQMNENRRVLFLNYHYKTMISHVVLKSCTKIRHDHLTISLFNRWKPFLFFYYKCAGTVWMASTKSLLVSQLDGLLLWVSTHSIFMNVLSTTFRSPSKVTFITVWSGICSGQKKTYPWLGWNWKTEDRSNY